MGKVRLLLKAIQEKQASTNWFIPPSCQELALAPIRNEMEAPRCCERSRRQCRVGFGLVIEHMSGVCPARVEGFQRGLQFQYPPKVLYKDQKQAITNIFRYYNDQCQCHDHA